MRSVRLFIRKDEKWFSPPATGAFLIKTMRWMGREGCFLFIFRRLQKAAEK